MYPELIGVLTAVVVKLVVPKPLLAVGLKVKLPVPPVVTLLTLKLGAQETKFNKSIVPSLMPLELEITILSTGLLKIISALTDGSKVAIATSVVIGN